MPLDPRSFPRPPLLERISKHLLVKWPAELGGETIAETRQAYWVLETHHPPTYYFPPNDLKAPLKALPRQTYCEWKGRAAYWRVEPTSNPGKAVDHRIWSYPDPTKGFREIKDYLCFYSGPWECFVDGEQVEPQPGDFYGGWLTSDIVRDGVKGAPGTLGW